jgi:hypothetical protein
MRMFQISGKLGPITSVDFPFESNKILILTDRVSGTVARQTPHGRIEL